MKIITLGEAKNKKIENDEFLRIDLSVENISKIPLQILYYKEHGFRNFLLNYDFEILQIPISRALTKLKIENLLKLAKEYEVKIAFGGFTKCIFERDVLRPALRWDYENTILFNNLCNANSCIKIDTCRDCMFCNDCSGFSSYYSEKFGDDEFEPLTSNKDLEPVYLEEIDKIKSEAIKFYANKVLDDFIKDPFYKRKRFVFVKSYPKTHEEGSSQRFVYYIYNRDDDFEKSYDLLHDFFDKDFLSSIRKYLERSNQIVISMGLMNDDKIRKTIYFNIDEIEREEIDDISKRFDINIKDDMDIWGLGIDFKEKTPSYKIYYQKKSVSVLDLKRFVIDIPLDNKKNIMRFSNSLTKPMKGILFDFKYKYGEIYSKRIDISLQYNNFRLNQFALLFKINMAEYEDKELLTLSFEISKDKEEKINFYYELKLPEEEERDFNADYYDRY